MSWSITVSPGEMQMLTLTQTCTVAIPREKSFGKEGLAWKFMNIRGVVVMLCLVDAFGYCHWHNQFAMMVSLMITVCGVDILVGPHGLSKVCYERVRGGRVHTFPY